MTQPIVETNVLKIVEVCSIGLRICHECSLWLSACGCQNRPRRTVSS